MPKKVPAITGEPSSEAQEASLTTAASKAKAVNLSFSSESELAVYDAIARAAAADDRSVNQFIVRVLMGKEPFELPSAVSTTYAEPSL